MADIQIRPVENKDREWIVKFITQEWGSPKIVSRGKIYQVEDLPGLMAELDDQIVGLITYRIESDECEIITLNSLKEKRGIGTRLIESIKKIAQDKSCKRLWVITTNNNLEGLRFYQKRGFVLKALYPNAIEESRKLKPEIPKIGKHGIPIRDEIELEMEL